MQRLNREGVEAIRHHQYDKAEALFYKAYLYDPGDPFTLNNLGYVSELQGQVDRAEQLYKLSAEQGSRADIALSSEKALQGKPMKYAYADLQDVPMQVNRMNVDAIQLLEHDRGFEAEALLKHALALEPENAFTLNNMGVADEAIGDLDDALRYYRDAAGQRSKAPVVVTLKKSWRGKPVSQMAEDSAHNLQKRMSQMDPSEIQAIGLTARGVEAANQNDWPTAKKDFMEAYTLDPNSAFALNNRGYVAERDGDFETAQFFYDKARTAVDAGAKIGLATQSAAEGQQLAAVAGESGQDVNSELAAFGAARRQQTGPIVLVPRGAGAEDGHKNAPKQQQNTQPEQQPPASNQPQTPQ